LLETGWHLLGVDGSPGQAISSVIAALSTVPKTGKAVPAVRKIDDDVLTMCIESIINGIDAILQSGAPADA
jgi:hypothetical protein